MHCQQPCRSLLSTCFCWLKSADLKLEVVFGLLPCEFAWRVLRSDLVFFLSRLQSLCTIHLTLTCAPRCLLADDSVPAELVSATPKHLTRLGLARPTVPHGALPETSQCSSWDSVHAQDLNSFSCRDVHAVARVIARVTVWETLIPIIPYIITVSISFSI